MSVALFAPAPVEMDAPPTPADVARGAPPEALDQPAAVFLAAVAWDGPVPDPDTLDAATFLSWL